MKEVMAVLGGAVAMIVVFTLLQGGNFTLGTGKGGPYAQLGYKL